LFRRGIAIPTTTAGILGAVVRLLEESEEHHTFLQQAPLSGHAREYLTALSMAMTNSGAVEINEKDGCAVVTSASLALRNAGQLVKPPDQMTVLNELVKHHVLDRLEFPSTIFRFQHQQFQEFFAARSLKRQLLELVRRQDAELEREFATHYVNEPRWDDSLSMLAGNIAEEATNAGLVNAGATLVRMALHVDAPFAANLVNASGPAVWAQVRDEVGKRLRAWYTQEDIHHRQCALSAMLATGSADFKDIIVPLLSHSNEQVRLAAYHRGARVLPTNLGPNWQEMIRGWPEEARLNFVVELADNPWLADSVEEIALADPSTKVRWNAAQALNWHGFRLKAEGLLKSLEDASLIDILPTVQPDDLPRSQWARVAAVYEQMYNQAADYSERLRLLHALQNFGGTNTAERTKAELDALGPEQLKPGDNQGLIHRALEELQKSDPKWVSQWVTRKLLDTSVWLGSWRGLVTEIPNEERETLYDRFSTEHLNPAEEQRVKSVLICVMDSTLAARLFAEACAIHAELSHEQPHDQAKSNLFRQVHDLLRAVDPAILLDGISEKLEKEPQISELDILTDILPSKSLATPDVRSSISDEMRLKLREYLKSAVKLGRNADGLPARTRANLALLLANVAGPEDLADIRLLIEADTARFEKVQVARMRGDRSQDASGYGFLYLDAVTTFDPTQADEVIVDLIHSGQYEYIAERLPSLARKNRDQSGLTLNRLDFNRIWRSRAGELDGTFVEVRRTRFADAVRERIERVKREREAATDKRGFDHRLKTLGGVLAALDGKRSAELVLELMELPGRGNDWNVVGAIENLLCWGMPLTVEQVLRILDLVLQHIRASGLYNDQNASLFARCLSVMAFVEPPAAGIARIRSLVSELPFRPDALNGVVGALGASRCEDAIDVLMDFAGAEGKGTQTVGDSWIKAIGSFEGARTTQILLSFVDPNARLFGEEFVPGDRVGDVAVRLLAERAEKDQGLKSRLLDLANSDLLSNNRTLLAKVFAQFAEERDRVSALSILRDDSGVPYELVRSMESAFLEHRPYETYGNAYTLHPRGSNAVRKKLFEMVIGDPHRKNSAFTLIGQIEVWRLEHGHPADEPRHPVIDSGVSWPPFPADFRMSQLRDNKPSASGRTVVTGLPVLEFSDFGEVGFKTSNAPQLYPPRGFAFFVRNSEQRFETWAQNLNCCLTMKSVDGQELSVEAAPWFQNRADVSFGHFYFQTTSLRMLETAGVVCAIFLDSGFHTALYASDTSPREGQRIPYGEWGIKLKIEGNNVKKTFQGKLELLPQGSVRFVPFRIEETDSLEVVPASNGPLSTPRVFITYSWGSVEHRSWVEALAIRLRGDGVDTILDRWNLKPGHDRFVFMESSIAEADFVLIVCTQEYAEKANGRTGGVGYEATIITPELAGKVRQTKFIPILRDDGWDNAVPRWLRSRIGFDLRGMEYDEAEYGALLRHLHDATETAPPIGHRPEFTTQRFDRPLQYSEGAGNNTRPSHESEDLSSKEVELVWAAAQDPRGEILHSKTLDGEGLRTNGRQFLENADVRSAVEWLGAFRNLERRSFVEPLTQARDFFRLTGRGYEAADRLNGFRRWSADSVVLRARYSNAPAKEHTVYCNGIVALPPTYSDSKVSGDDSMRSVKEQRTLIVEGVDSAPQLGWSPTEIEFIDVSTGNTQIFNVRELQLQRRSLKLPLYEQ
jgi:hypothetical protein